MRAGSTEGCFGEVAGEQKEAFLEGTASFRECLYRVPGDSGVGSRPFSLQTMDGGS